MRRYTKGMYTSDGLLVKSSSSRSGFGSHLIVKVIGALIGTMFVMGLFIQNTGAHNSLRMRKNDEALLEMSSSPYEEDRLNSKILKGILSDITANDSDILDENSVQFEISFNGNPVTPDQYIPMDQASQAPSISVNGEGYFTWLLIDIDAPNPENPTHSPFLHYIVANLNAKRPNYHQIVQSYYPVSPPTGEHRYISLLFRQEGKEPESEGAEQFIRANFNVIEYVKEHHLRYAGLAEFYSKPSFE